MPLHARPLRHHLRVSAVKLVLTGVFSDDVFESSKFTSFELSKSSKSYSVSRFFDLNVDELRSSGFNASNTRATLRAVFCAQLTNRRIVARIPTPIINHHFASLTCTIVPKTCDAPLATLNPGAKTASGTWSDTLSGLNCGILSFWKNFLRKKLLRYLIFGKISKQRGAQKPPHAWSANLPMRRYYRWIRNR